MNIYTEGRPEQMYHVNYKTLSDCSSLPVFKFKHIRVRRNFYQFFSMAMKSYERKYKLMKKEPRAIKS